ncbi:hypothetical protein C8R43DRAFT_1009665 [Mycena crocata]|nr:hypothetical protein C8R43DRAFT_1009665 [Mycena crocata]
MAGIGSVHGSKLLLVAEDSGEPFEPNDPSSCPQMAEIADNRHIPHKHTEANLGLQLVEAHMHRLHLEPEAIHVADSVGLGDRFSAPIGRIPTEILSAIFVCYADLMAEDAPSRQRGPIKDGVWALGLICRHWRAVALSTHALWSSLRFWFFCSCKLKNAGALAEEFLRRAGNHCMTIHFGCFGRGQDPSGYHQHCKPVLSALLAKCRQWKVTSFHISRHLYDDMAIISGNLPLLEKLTFRFTARRDLPGLNGEDTFRSCPRLIDLTLSPFQQYIEFPWHQLTCYTGEMHFDGDKDVLTLAPNLQKCSFPWAIRGEAVTHQMRSLTLSLPFGRPRLRQLILPALEHLSFVTSDHIRDLRDMIALARTAPALSFVEIEIPNLPCDLPRLLPSMLDFFAAVPALERLRLVDKTKYSMGEPSYDEKATAAAEDGAEDEEKAGRQQVIHSAPLFDGLMRRADATVPLLLPRLRKLILTGMEFDDALVRMVQSRCVAPAPGRARLALLSVSYVRRTDRSHLLRLQQLEHQLGLQLTIE